VLPVPVAAAVIYPALSGYTAPAMTKLVFPGYIAFHSKAELSELIARPYADPSGGVHFPPDTAVPVGVVNE
jgi:hypothetical protein